MSLINKEIELKENVAVNKKEFVMKMLPVVDSFLDAPHVAPASTEREEKMHESFGSLLKGILNVFNKYGYQEFTVENGSKFEAIIIGKIPA
jgi:molecular chaperone GrpE (heat shock protein)